MNVAFLVDRLDQPGWVRDLIGSVREMPGVQGVSFALADTDRTMGPSLGAKLADACLAGVQRLEARQLNPVEHALFHRENISEQFKDVTVRHLPAEQPNKGNASADDADENPDLILVVAMHPVRESLSLRPKYGYWALSHSHASLGSDRHGGFAEVSERIDHTRLSLIRLGRKACADHIIHQRSFNTEYYWLKNRARAFMLGNLVLTDAIAALDGRPSAATAGPPLTDLPERHAPNIFEVAAYVAKQAVLSAGIVYRKLAKRGVYWRIGMSRTGLPPFHITDIDVLTAPKGRFFADPFIYTHQGEPYVFFEDYAFADGRGKVSAAKYVDGKFEFQGVVLDLPYHLSFPFIFNYEGTVYMMPETCGNKTIELWRCTDFPLRWERHVTLMDNVSAVDSLLFPHENRWWLLTNIDRSGGLSHSDELMAFHADSPVSTNWTPHKQNPIVSDPARARNGGMFISETGEITRAAQYQGFCHYGKGVSLNKIKELTPDSYIEEPGPVHYADFVSGSRPSTHHCHQQGGHTVFDFSFIE